MQKQFGKQLVKKIQEGRTLINHETITKDPAHPVVEFIPSNQATLEMTIAYFRNRTVRHLFFPDTIGTLRSGYYELLNLMGLYLLLSQRVPVDHVLSELKKAYQDCLSRYPSEKLNENWSDLSRKLKQWLTNLLKRPGSVWYYTFDHNHLTFLESLGYYPETSPRMELASQQSTVLLDDINHSLQKFFESYPCSQDPREAIAMYLEGVVNQMLPILHRDVRINLFLQLDQALALYLRKYRTRIENYVRGQIIEDGYCPTMRLPFATIFFNDFSKD